MFFGDVFQYKEEFLNGEKTDNHIIIAVTNCYVICTLEKIFNLDYFNSITEELFKIYLRKLSLDKFKEWYPIYLYNIFNKAK